MNIKLGDFVSDVTGKSAGKLLNLAQNKKIQSHLKQLQKLGWTPPETETA